MSAKPKISMISPVPEKPSRGGRLRLLTHQRLKPSDSPRGWRVSHHAERRPHVSVRYLGDLRHNSQRSPRLHLDGERIVAPPCARGRSATLHVARGIEPCANVVDGRPKPGHVHARRPGGDVFVMCLVSLHRVLRGALDKLTLNGVDLDVDCRRRSRTRTSSERPIV